MSPTAVATPEGDADLRALMQQAFDVEDQPIIEASYANLDGGDFWAQRPVFLSVDAGGTRARRVMQKMLAQERASSTGIDRASAALIEASPSCANGDGPPVCD